MTLTASQLRINQRISQAAVRRINALTARVDGLPPPEPGAGGTPGRVTLSVAQLLINQRISQAAVRRANALDMRLRGEIPPTDVVSRRPSGTVTLSARQLLIGQRIAQAAVRRANALAERIPELPFPPPDPLSPELDDFIGFLRSGHRAVMEVSRVRRHGPLGDNAPVAVGDLMPVTLPPYLRPPFGDNAPIGAIGVFHGGVMYGIYVSIEPPLDQR